MTSVKENISSSANEMLTKIKLNNFENIILALTFYKLLSEKTIEIAKNSGATESELDFLTEKDPLVMDFIKSHVGCFIAHKNLFSSWIELGSDFDISHVRDALHAFSRLNPNHTNIFENLQGSLCELGDTASEQTKTISKLIWSFGYKSHHAVQGDIKLVTQVDHKATVRAVRLIKTMATTSSIEEIQFKSDLTKTSGDSFFDYYMNLATNEAELLYQLTIHQAIFQKMVSTVDAKRDPEIIDGDDLKALMPSSLPKEIVYALCIEIDDSERPYMVYASFLEDIINMREVVSTFIINNSCNS